MQQAPGFYDLKDEAQADEYLKNVQIEYQFQCYHEKQNGGCHRLASFLETVRKDWKEAHKVFRDNCIENKHGPSCFKLGTYKMLGRACEKSEEEALKCFELGCDLKDGPSCHNAALMHLETKGKKDKVTDFKNVVEFLSRGCEYNDYASCYRLSGLYIQGTGMPKNMELAFKYSLKACEHDNLYACVNVSRMYRLGEGVEKNLEMSKHFKDRASHLYNSIKERNISSGGQEDQK